MLHLFSVNRVGGQKEDSSVVFVDGRGDALWETQVGHDSSKPEDFVGDLGCSHELGLARGLRRGSLEFAFPGDCCSVEEDEMGTRVFVHKKCSLTPKP